MESNFQSLFAHLEGEWQLVRSFSTGDRFEGKAQFSNIGGNHFRLSEAGELHLQNDQSLAATRNWIWTVSGPDTLTVWYDEEPLRLYHSVRLKQSGKAWTGSASHLCIRDHYDGEYSLTRNRLEISHHVKGMAKNYRFVSIFCRQDGSLE